MNDTLKLEKALRLTKELWQLLLDLEVKHEDDIHEHRRDIHNIQNRLMARKYKS